MDTLPYEPWTPPDVNFDPIEIEVGGMLNDQFKYFMEWCVKSMIPLRVSSVNTCPGCKTQINFWPCRTLLRRSKRKLLSPSLTLNPLLLKLPGLLPKMLMTRFLRHKLIPRSRRICWIVRWFFLGSLVLYLILQVYSQNPGASGY